MSNRMNFFLLMQSYSEKQQLPRNLADSSLTCMDKRLNLGQNKG
jgi:hypothetical protein